MIFPCRDAITGRIPGYLIGFYRTEVVIYIFNLISSFVKIITSFISNIVLFSLYNQLKVYYPNVKQKHQKLETM